MTVRAALVLFSVLRCSLGTSAATSSTDACSAESTPHVKATSMLQASKKMVAPMQAAREHRGGTTTNTSRIEGWDVWLTVDLDASKKAHDRAVQGGVLQGDAAADIELKPKVAFLFLVMDGVEHEAAWDAFFEQAPLDAYSIFVHRASLEPVAAPPFAKWGAVMVPQVPSRWCALSGVEIALLGEALTDRANTQFVFLSHQTIPLKPFKYVYGELLDRSPRSSKLCFSQNQPRVSMKHHQWSVLSREHAFRLVENAERVIHTTYAALQKADVGCCGDELSIATALVLDRYGDEPPDMWRTSEEDLRDIGVEKACLTWVYWNDEDFVGTLLEIGARHGAPHAFGPPGEHEEYAHVEHNYLETLVARQGFMFGRKFLSGCLVKTGEHYLPLAVVLPVLWGQLDTNEAEQFNKVSLPVWSAMNPEGMPP